MIKKDFPSARRYLGGNLATEFKQELRQLLACHAALEKLVKSTMAKKPFSSPEMIKLFEKAEAALEGKI